METCRKKLRVCKFNLNICRLILITFLVGTVVHTANSSESPAGTKRLVLLKVDGLSFHVVERVVRMRNSESGKSYLPWIEKVFFDNGTCLANFYVRGMSLSGPSWSMLDTGQNLQIKGNVEYGRMSLRSYDYLNFIPFYINSAMLRRVDMPGVEVLDDAGIPLLIDAYSYDQRYVSFQLYQRGFRWTTLQRGLQNRFTKQSPRELIDEWTIGLDFRDIVFSQLEREVIESLNNTQIRYLDYYTSVFDHVAHGNPDFKSQLTALQEIDALVGRIWTAIEHSPLAKETMLVLVSDHGTNTNDRIYSQGYNLVKLLGSPSGGGHHVITKRRLMLDYSIKGIYPLVPLITTTTPDSYYLKNQHNNYPTALLDFDGNERASIHLRNSDVNLMHILLQELKKNRQPPQIQKALTSAFFSVIDKHRAKWEKDVLELKEELAALRRAIEKLTVLFEAQPKKWTKAERDAGRDKEAIRIWAKMDSWTTDERDHKEYVRTLENLLALRLETFNPQRIKIEDIIAKRTMGDGNTLYQLQNYVVGLAANGLVLKPDGSLDMQKSFKHINYFDLLLSIKVRNNVQLEVSHQPVDFVAVRLPSDKVAEALDSNFKLDNAIWIYSGINEQALILARRDNNGQLLLQYLPVKALTQSIDGQINFIVSKWRSGLPFEIWEDEKLNVNGDRQKWLEGWHSDTEWLQAMHQTKYSTAIIGLHEQLIRHEPKTLPLGLPKGSFDWSEDDQLMFRFRRRLIAYKESDLLVLANNHWNFDVRGFNPGGNHGSFFRVSTHSTLMFAGGAETGIPRNLIISTPYDSLSFVPTVLALTGHLENGEPSQKLRSLGFQPFPGPVIKELMKENRSKW